MADNDNDGDDDDDDDESREEEDVEVVDPAVLLKQIKKQGKTNKLLLTIVLVISGVVITVMATGLTVMFLKLADLSAVAEAASEDHMEDQFLALEQQLMLVADFRKSELKKIKAYTKQLEKIANDCSLEKAAPYRDFLSSREKDFQALVSTVKSGATSLAGMSKGSRQWLSSHNNTLDELKESSVVRRAKLDDFAKSSGEK